MGLRTLIRNNNPPNMKKYLILIMFCLPKLIFSQINMGDPTPFNFDWKNIGNPGFSPGAAFFTSSALSSGGQLFISFCEWDYGDENSVMTFDGSAWNFVGARSFSSPDKVFETYIAISPTENQPYVAFYPHDNHGVSKNARVMKFNGSAWVNVGNPYFSSGPPGWITLAFSSSGQPFVAFGDGGNSYKATVMKFDGTTWVNVGNPGFSMGRADGTSIALNSSDNQPYVAFQDFSNSKKATVMRFDGTNWVNIGNPGFSQGPAYFTCLAFNSSDNQPYVAFQDYDNSQKVTVMKFDGTNWVNVGNPGFTQGKADFISLAFNSSDNQPCVSFMDYSNSQKASVMRFDGTNWVYVGSQGFSAGEAYGVSLTINSSGIPHVVYSDRAYSYKATAMKYDSVYTGIKTPVNPTFSLYPNPVSKKITIDLTNIFKNPKDIEIDDIHGISLFNGKTDESKFIFDMDGFPSGIYLVKVRTNNGYYVKKIIKY
jgi:hypothetical protein